MASQLALVFEESALSGRVDLSGGTILGRPNERGVMKKCIAAVLLCSLIFAFAPPTAFACGGPAMDDIDHPLQPAATLLAWLTIVPCNSDSTCQFIEDLPTIPELLFLNPFRLSRPKET